MSNVKDDPDLDRVRPYAESLGIDLGSLSESDLEPPTLRGAIADNVRIREGRDFDIPTNLVDITSRHVLDIDGFLEEIDIPLRNDALGWVLQIQRDGDLVATRQWRIARTERDDFLNWNPDVTHHVASISKMVTAAAFMKTIDEHDVSLDTRLVEVLPSYWSVGGPYVHLMTLRQLLRHRAGLGWDAEGSGGVSLKSARRMVANGANRPIPVGESEWPLNYDNGNFTIARILLPVIAGEIDRNLSAAAIGNDLIWNALTAKYYENYVQENVFRPAGLTEISLAKRPTNSLAYAAPDPGSKGWNSGGFEALGGPVGWHFNVQELMMLAEALRTPGMILRQEQFSRMKNLNIGFEFHRSNDVGIYFHGGKWTRKSTGQQERSMLFFLPEKIEIAILLSSAQPAGSRRIQDTIFDAYLNNSTVVQDPIGP